RRDRGEGCLMRVSSRGTQRGLSARRGRQAQTREGGGMTAPQSGRAVLLVARREFRTRVRTKSFVIGTAVIILMLVGLVLLQTLLFDRANHSTVGLAGQATALSAPQRDTARSLGKDVEVRDVVDARAGGDQVRRGDLDALVTGAP